MPSVITVDFENSLISAVKHEFQKSPILELLTLIPINEISLGIEYIKIKTINEYDAILFWTYFQNAWIKKYNPTLWTLCNIEDMEIFGRTNNALERYNRRLNDFFVNSHPNLASFVSIIKNEFLYHSELCKQIRQDSSNIHFGQGLFQ
ncbi:hypothetical protein HZS_7382 [Henneguya salminicola]|nr:hypothetical protein HZS_7382 [Henneguya salminicola]